MAKINFQSNPKVNEIFDDLEKFLEFCVEYGYRYNEKELYDSKSYAYRQYHKHMQGKPVVNNWEADSKAD